MEMPQAAQDLLAASFSQEHAQHRIVNPPSGSARRPTPT
jgi:hypothetical protein